MAWNPAFITLILFSTFLNYAVSLKIYNSKDEKVRKRVLIICLVISLGLLFVFKYLGFINETFAFLASMLKIKYKIPRPTIILPMGISFFTFQAIGYTIDVYRKRIKAERNFFKLSLFITFFPQLVAGPIERFESLMPQLFTSEKKKFNFDNIVMGSKFMIFGFFKKIVVADRLAIAVNTVFNYPQKYEGLSLIIAALFFTFQIYCDFSGYSDIAIGCAKVLDVDLMQNFKQPFLSKNIKEFWRRWHISLSGWFKDYLYIPLGGNRKRKNINTIITFLLSGLWHGANWTFVIWGLLHGIYQVSGIIKGRILTFISVVFAFIFFRAKNLSSSIYIICNLFKGIKNWTNVQYVYYVFNEFGITFFEVILVIALIMILFIIDMASKDKDIHSILLSKNWFIRLSFYVILTSIVVCLGVFSNAGQFIYFQF